MAADAADRAKKAAHNKRARESSSEDELEGGAGSDASISSMSDDERRRRAAEKNKMQAKELNDLHSTKTGIQKKIEDAKLVNEAKLKELRETRNSFSSDIAVCDLFIKIFFSHTN